MKATDHIPVSVNQDDRSIEPCSANMDFILAIYVHSIYGSKACFICSGTEISSSVVNG